MLGVYRLISGNAISDEQENDREHAIAVLRARYDNVAELLGDEDWSEWCRQAGSLDALSAEFRRSDYSL